MMANKIEFISNDSISFGKFNAILFFRDVQSYLQIVCDDIVNLFKPDEINWSLFDLDNLEMKEIGGYPSSQASNSIIRAIFGKEAETIIVEYYNGQFIIENLCRYDNVQAIEGSSVISKYLREKMNSSLIIGYELSIHISSYSSSLEENSKDTSLHPIVVVKKINGAFEKEEYVSYVDAIVTQKLATIK